MKLCKMNYFNLFCKSYLVLFQNLSCHSDFMIHHHGFRDVLGIFGVAFVRALASTLVSFSIVRWSRSSHYSCRWAFKAVKQLVAAVNQKALE